MRQATPDGQIHVSVTHMRAPAYPLGRDHARNARETTHGAQRRCRVSKNEALGTVCTSQGRRHPSSGSIRPLARAKSTVAAGVAAPPQSARSAGSTPRQSSRTTPSRDRLRRAAPASRRRQQHVDGGESSACWEHLQRCRERAAHEDRGSGSREHPTLDKRARRISLRYPKRVKIHQNADGGATSRCVNKRKKSRSGFGHCTYS